MEGLEAEPDPDHQAEAEEDRGQEQQEEQQAHVGGRVQLQVDDTELATSPGGAQVLHRREYSPLVLSILTSDKS